MNCQLIIAAVTLIAVASPAEAAPVVAFFGAIGSAISTFAASSVLAGFLVRTALSIGLSLLSRALQKKQRQPGIQTDATTSGGRTPQKFILGRYATGGQLIAPPNSYATADGMPRALLVYPIALSVVAGCTVERVIINDAYVTWTASGDPEWPAVGTGDFGNIAWFDYEDGSQTVAHPGLITAFGTDVDRPWLSDMIGPGTCYAVLRFRFSRGTYSGLPSVRFEVMGIPLYDPRLDSTVGGTGAHRWASSSTWAQTENPMVMIYNILRGIDVGGGQRWGGDCLADDLPLSNWFAAMNACDVAVAKPVSGTEAQYRAGIEVSLADEPASVIEELLKTCAGQIFEIGGTWKVRVGPPSLPTYFIIDDDIIVSQEQEFEPFPGLSETFNGIACTYPEPESLWEPKEAPPRYNATWETEDGGRRLVASLDLAACIYSSQVQRLMASYIADHRRFRRHRFALPPEAAVLEPLETIGWTSARYGYTAKVFEITSVVDALMTLIQGVSVRERDGADFSWSVGDYVPTSPGLPGTTAPLAQTVPGFAASGVSLLDATGTARRAALLLTWTPAGALDAHGIKWQVRVLGSTTVSLSGMHSEFADGELRIADGVLSATTYQVRAQLVVDRATSWTAWISVTTPTVLLGEDDVDIPGVSDATGVGLISAGRLFRVSPETPPGSALSRVGVKAVATAGEDDSRTAAFWLDAIASGKSRMVSPYDQFLIWSGAALIQPYTVSGGNVVLQNVKIGADVILDKAVSRQHVGAKGAGSTTVSAVTEATAVDIISSFTVDLAASKGDNPVLVLLSGKVAAVTSPACLNFVMEFEYTAGSGVWASVGTGQPFHVINNSTGTNAHHFTYAFLISHADLHLFQRLRVRCWVASAAPFNSRTIAVDALIAQIQQVNR